jgi:hypothetical protein
MKNILKLSVLCAILAQGATQVGAQTLVQNLTIALSGYIQGTNSDNGTNTTQTLTAAQVTTKTVIQALGAALGTTFSAKAQLQAVLDTSGLLQSVVVTNGGQQTDVTTFFTVTDGNSVSKSKTNDSTGAGSQTEYVVREISFANPGGLSFDVQGFSVIAASTTAGSGGTTKTLIQFAATVAGSGTDANGNTMVLKGIIAGTKN